MAVNLHKHGPYALITGASAGIGEEFAKQLAAKGFHLILVARRKEKLDQLAVELGSAFNVKVLTVALDLKRPDAIETLALATESLEVSLVILNAGVYGFGSFLDNKYEDEISLLQLNVISPFSFAHHYAEKMRARSRGGIIFVSSTAGFQGLPFAATYSASKAFVTTLAEALNYEFKKFNVDVGVLAPGMVRTEGSGKMRGADIGKIPGGLMETGPVVAAALDSLGSRVIVIPGFLTAALVGLSKILLPRSAQTRMAGDMISKALK